jgi:hypothetical protein
MLKHLSTAGLFLMVLMGGHHLQASVFGDPDHALAMRALSDDAAVRAHTAHELRARGEPGLKLLLRTHAALVEGLLHGEGPRTQPMKNLVEVADAVAAQKEAWASGLYWHTRTADAQAQSKATGRPILALHLLGNLDEDLSCANSRFFRTILYPDPAIATFMREHFVLEWVSVAKAPVMTVRFGDGRELVRTITGNSYHEVVGVHGDVLDVLPGMVTPQEFLAWLQQVHTLSSSLDADAGRRVLALRTFHQRAREQLDQAFMADAARVGLKVEPHWLDQRTRELWSMALSLGRGRMAAALSITKAITEDRFLDAYDRRRSLLREDDTWTALAGARVLSVIIAHEAWRVMKANSDPRVEHVGDLSVRGALAEDSVRNRYLLHRILHQWGEQGTLGPDRAALQKRIYASLFLTPLDDPWMNLAPPDVYVALPNGGLRTP